MGIGLGIVLLAVGLIFALNVVDLPASWDQHVDSNTLGWILVIVGALAIVLSLIINAQRRRTIVADDRPVVTERRLPPEV
jgi:hypothetical protein